ncbi:MAG TPA: tRNA preQ1(34) S-adenosylmethionine ribosyltransferase-isomerase QueA, partial [Chromatiales bacterium]|nr:tRNA preQ1(34) S-adenosylmethionine ribosyltransferase-isomerase QueA [Chromatiales bacterium]
MSPDVCAEPCLDDFDFELPGELIAQSPLPQRHSSRLLHLDGTTACEDLRFTDLPGLLQAGDLLVLNDTRVIPARLFGRKATGGRVEILLERMLDTERARVQIRASKAPKPGMQIELEGGDQARVLGRDGSFFVLRFSRAVQSVLDEHGHMPLPPYIERADEPVDRVRYQTVFARDPGAVAAPTAGLHFDEAMLESLQDRGVQTGFVTLHVGAGTFQPLRAEQLASGKLHAER